ncbi:MAG: hypothetical protein HC912_04660, partial [Saprospiraceae bacterium]|nr:hypothetical protein [Saprospiraceae bacterium]
MELSVTHISKLVLASSLVLPYDSYLKEYHKAKAAKENKLNSTSYISDAEFKEKFDAKVASGLAETDGYIGGTFYLGKMVERNQTHMFWGLQAEYGKDVEWYHINYDVNSTNNTMSLKSFNLQKHLARGATIDIKGVGVDKMRYDSMVQAVNTLASKGERPENWVTWSCAVGACNTMQSGIMSQLLHGDNSYPSPTGVKGEYPNTLFEWFSGSSKVF